MCSVIGGVLIVIGLYAVLWGKHKEGKEIKEEEMPEAIKGPHCNGTNGISVVEDIEANGTELKKSDIHQLMNNNKLVAIAMPIKEPCMKSIQEPKA